MRLRKCWPLFAYLFCACSSAPIIERYRELDGESKAVFLSYYPTLKPEERQELLDIADSPDSILKNWKIDSRPIRDPLDFFPKLMADRKSYTISALRIEPERALPIREGDELKLRAFAEYADGRRTEVTPDVIWSVQPRSLASIEGKEKYGLLRFSCSASDLEVGANFLDERQGLKKIEIRKPIQSLEMSVADSSQSIEKGITIRFQLIARCEDGTAANVSCQALWKTQSQLGKMKGCGHFQVLPKHLPPGQTLEVTAQYGDHLITQTVNLPERRP